MSMLYRSPVFLSQQEAVGPADAPEHKDDTPSLRRIIRQVFWDFSGGSFFRWTPSYEGSFLGGLRHLSRMIFRRRSCGQQIVVVVGRIE